MKKISSGLKKYLRRRKAEIRQAENDPQKQKELFAQLYKEKINLK